LVNVLADVERTGFSLKTLCCFYVINRCKCSTQGTINENNDTNIKNGIIYYGFVHDRIHKNKITLEYNALS